VIEQILSARHGAPRLVETIAVRPAQAAKIVIASGSNGFPVGSAPSVSLMPR